MSRENVEAVRQVLAAISGRDLSRLLDLTDPEIEWRSFFAALSETGEYHGHDGMREYVRDLEEAFESIRPEPDDLLDAGDVVVGIGRVHYRGRGSGVETDSPAGWVFRFRDGRLLAFPRVPGPRAGPRSRRAAGLGDVAGDPMTSARSSHTADAISERAALSCLGVAMRPHGRTVAHKRW